jgi:hypothetical protein
MKKVAAIMILVWAAIFALFISKLSEQKTIEPAEEHKFTFVNIRTGQEIQLWHQVKH